jgi:preprotein translocase subunit SecG
MFPILLAVQVLVSIGIIALVLLQQGKGANMGAGFGSGASGTVFGARGSGSFLTRTTAILAAVFFINCLMIASPLVRESGKTGDSLADRIEQQSKQNQTVEKPVAAAESTGAPQDDTTDKKPEIPGQLMNESDVPNTPPAAAPDSPAPDDLPN